jgi:hypothetical protein
LARRRRSSVSSRVVATSPISKSHTTALARVTEAIGNSSGLLPLPRRRAGAAGRIRSARARIVVFDRQFEATQIGERSSSTHYFFTAAATLSPNCNIARIDNDPGPYSAGSVATFLPSVCLPPKVLASSFAYRSGASQIICDLFTTD